MFHITHCCLTDFKFGMRVGISYKIYKFKKYYLQSWIHKVTDKLIFSKTNRKNENLFSCVTVLAALKVSHIAFILLFIRILITEDVLNQQICTLDTQVEVTLDQFFLNKSHYKATKLACDISHKFLNYFLDIKFSLGTSSHENVIRRKNCD